MCSKLKLVYILIVTLSVLSIARLNAQPTDASLNTWFQKNDVGTSSKTNGLTNMYGPSGADACAFSIGNKGYVGLGFTEVGTLVKYSDAFWQYDPDNGLWTQKANFAGGGRACATGFSIGSKGYICGGTNGQNYFNDFWEYDAIANIWSQKNNFPGGKRLRAAAFVIGNKGYLGTGTTNYGPSNPAFDSIHLVLNYANTTNDFWEYNPTNDSWLQRANFPGNTRASASAFAINGKGYLGMGANYFNFNNYNINHFKDFWEYDPNSDIWLQKADLPGDARRCASSFSINNKGYVGLGTNYEIGYLETDENSWRPTFWGSHKSDMWEYNPTTNLWVQKANGLLSGFSEKVCFTANGKAFIGLGRLMYDADVAPHYDYKKKFCQYDPATDLWGMISDYAGSSRVKAASFSVNGKGYIVGGASYAVQTSSPSVFSDFHNDVWEYSNDNAGYWTQKADFPGTARSGARSFTINNKAYIAFGSGASGTAGFNQALRDIWEFNPSTNSWVQKATDNLPTDYPEYSFSVASKIYVGYTYLGLFREYNPATDSWTTKNSPPNGVVRGNSSGVSFNIGDKGYVGLGYNYPSTNNYNYLNDFWEYSPATDSWLQKANFPGQLRMAAVGFSIWNKGYITTGYRWDGTNYTYLPNDLWEYNQTTDSWLQKAAFAGYGRIGASSFVIGNNAYVGQGHLADPTQSLNLNGVNGVSWDGTNLLKDFWQYRSEYPLIITSFTPTTASSDMTITIHGYNFLNASAVSFGGTNAVSFTIINDTTITAVVGLGASGNFSVTNVDGAGSLAGFTYIKKWFVTQTGAGSKNGLSWAHASDDLATIIKNAAPTDEVWIAGGIYKPKYDGLGNNVSGGDSYQKKLALFDLSNGISLFGGFVGNETLKEQRSFNALNTNVANTSNQTTLSGMVSNVAGNWNDYAGDVVGIKYLTTNVTVDGVIIQDANPTNAHNNGFLPNTLGFGGGMLIFNARNLLTVSNCKFTNNAAYALSNIAYAYSGANDSSSPVIKNCYFTGNLNAGGTSYTIYNYTDGNINTGVWAKSKPSITNCVLRDNTTMYGIGNYANGNAELKPTISDCILYHTGASNYGGAAITNRAAMWALNTTLQSVCKPVIKNTVIAYCYGYAIYNAETDPTGGKLCEPEFINNTIYQNTGQAYNAPYDNALYQVLNNGTNATFTNSIIWGSDSSVGSFYNRSSQNGWGGGYTTSNPIISYSNIKGDSTGTGNIDKQPLFVNPAKPEGDDGIYFTADDGFQNATGSPVINAGTTTSATTDIIGTSRPLGAAYDMGAYEGVASAKCTPLVVTNLSASNITTNSATINWVDLFDNGAHHHEYFVSKRNIPPDSSTLTNLWNWDWAAAGWIWGMNTSYNCTNLDYGTTYYYWINSYCGSTKSAWVGSSFTTACLPSTGTPSVSIALDSGQLNNCSGRPVRFKVTISNFIAPITSFNWNYSGANGTTNGDTYTTANPINGGSRDIFCTVSVSNSCQIPMTVNSNSISLTGIVKLTPTISISSSKTNGVCLASQVTYTANITNGGSSPSYQWKLNGANIAGATNSTYDYSYAASTITDAISCELTANNECQTTNSVVSNSIGINADIVNYRPTLIINTNCNNSILGTNVTFYAIAANSGTTPSYQWKLNGSNIAGATSNSYATTTFHTGDIVTCVLTISSGCTLTSNAITMTMLNPPTVSINSDKGTAICPTNNYVTFTANPGIEANNPTYVWKKNGTLYLGGQYSYTSYSTNVVNNDTIICTMTSTSVCNFTTIVSDTFIVQTVTPYSPSVSISASASGSVCSGSSVTYTATPVDCGSIAYYTWYRENSSGTDQVIAGITGNTYTISSINNSNQLNGIYCVVFTNNACQNTSYATSNNIYLSLSTPVSPTVSISSNTGVLNYTSCVQNSPAGLPFTTLTANTTNAGTNPTYIWKVNGVTYIDGNINNINFKTIYLTSFGVVGTRTTTVDIINNDGGCLVTNTASSSNSATVILLPVQINSVSITTSAVDTVLQGSVVHFTATTTPAYNVSYSAYYTFTWFVNNVQVYTSNSPFYDNYGALQNGDIVKCVSHTDHNPNNCVYYGDTTSNSIVIHTKQGICSNLISPANNTTNVSVSGTQLTWSSVSEALGYDVYINGSYYSHSYDTSIWTNSNLQSNTQYSWYVVPTGTYGAYLSFTCQNNQYVFTTEYVNPLQVADDCMAAVNLQDNTPINSSTTTATESLPLAACDMNAGMMGSANDVWFTFNQMNAGQAVIEISNQDMGFQPLIEVFNGDCMMGLNSVDCSNSNQLNAWLNMGTYYVRVYGTNNTTGNFTITLNPQQNTPAPTVSISSNVNNVCAGTPITFTANATDVSINVLYEFFVNGISKQSGSSNTYTPNTILNNDVINCSIYDGANIATSNNISLTVNSVTPSVTISTAATTVCSGSNTTFTAIGVNGGSSPVFQWKKNGVNAGTGSSITFLSNTLSNNDVITCVLTANNVCQTSATATSNAITMTVNASPSVAPITNGVSTVTTSTVCTLGTTAHYFNGTINGTWSSSNPTVASVAGNGLSGFVTANTNGTATITYSVTSSGCVSTSSLLVTVAAITPNSITGTNSICVNATTALSCTAPVGTTGVWTSSNNRGTINVGGVYTGANAGAGEARYSVTNSTTGCKAYSSYVITVNVSPSAPSITYAPGTTNPQAGAGGGSNFCTNRTFTVVGSPAGGVWSKTGVLSVTNPGGVVSTGAIAGAGSLTYTYTSAAGCVSSRSISGSVVTCASRGVVDNRQWTMNNNQWTLYPNPAKSVVNINVETLIGKGTIVVTDLYGKTVTTQALSMGTNTVDIANLSKGMYFVSTITSEGKTTKKLIVE